MPEHGAVGNVSVLLSLGSNIDPARNVLLALDELGLAVELVAASRVFVSAGFGDREMPAFLNAAVEVRTELEPAQLKHDVLRAIESRLGRRRSADRNAPRQIDLDISLFGDLVLDDPGQGLVIPDPEILTRAHVAVPLADIAPGRIHPGDGRSLGAIAAGLAGRGKLAPAADSEALRRRLAVL